MFVICRESGKQVEEHLEKLRFSLETRAVSCCKTDCLCVNRKDSSGINDCITKYYYTSMSGTVTMAKCLLFYLKIMDVF